VLQTWPQLKEAYIDTGQVYYVFRDFPLPSHSNAHKAAEAARCAGAQGAFWEMRDRLFEGQGEWSQRYPENAYKVFVRYATSLGLDVAVFEECLQSGEFAEQIAGDIQAGQEAGVRGTPSFLINGRLVSGAYPFEDLERVIELELAKQP
jgi:protein-disulfide isomerase